MKKPLCAHCHNDMGCATANTITAAEAGAFQLHTTVNGIGERAGNAALEEVLVVLHMKGGVDRYDLSHLHGLSQLVESCSGRLVENIDLSYDIKVIAPGNVWLNRSPQQAEAGEDSVLFSVRIPVEALVGDFLTVSVHDRSSGEIVGTRTAFVPMESMTVRVEVLESCGCQSSDAVPTLFALLPGLLILVFAISLYYDQAERQPKG